jgi:predicted ABC-type ATPase
MIERIRAFVREGQSFGLETTCAGKSYIPLLKDCKAGGWSISLCYLWLPSPEDSIARVAGRAREGGHLIPDEVIYRRFQKGLWNMRRLYLPLADTAAIYDNSDESGVLIASRKDGSSLKIHDQTRWLRIEELS